MLLAGQILLSAFLSTGAQTASEPEAPPPEAGVAEEAAAADEEAPASESLEAAAEERWASCVEMKGSAPPTELRACLLDVVQRFPATSAAVKAAAALEMVDITPTIEPEHEPPAQPEPEAAVPPPVAPMAEPAPQPTDEPAKANELAEPPIDLEPDVTAEVMPPWLPSFLSPGHLELGFVGGVVGVWTGATAGVLASTNSEQMHVRIEPWVVVLGTGAAAVGTGLVGAASGYLVAHVFDFDQGHVWAITAGTTWGASYAISMLPGLYDIVRVPWYLNDDLIGLSPLVGAGLGAATGLGLGLWLDPDIAEVSMMNTGGWVGGVQGGLIGATLLAWTGQSHDFPALLLATSYAVTKTAGLLAGVGASQLLDLTWGETLIGDLGAILGGLAFGSIAAAFLISPWAEPTFRGLGLKGDDVGKAMLTVATTSVGTGVGVGVAATTVGLAAWHVTAGVPFLRLGELPFAAEIGGPIVLIDRHQQPTWGSPSLLVRW